MKVLALDIGGSGVKYAWVDIKQDSIQLTSGMKLIENPDWSRFGEWLASCLKASPEVLAVSCAGFIDPYLGINRLCTIADWIDYPLKTDLEKAFPEARVVLLNDIEAHLYAHVRDNLLPVMILAVGTSVGLAVSDEDGNILRARKGWPLEFGAVRLNTSASCDEFWSAIGPPGLKELQERKGIKDGAKHFGYRLGAFLAQYAGAFCPRTIVLSGGSILYNWDAMTYAVNEEFTYDLPRWLRSDPPRLICSPYGREAALFGVAQYAKNNMEL